MDPEVTLLDKEGLDNSRLHPSDASGCRGRTAPKLPSSSGTSHGGEVADSSRLDPLASSRLSGIRSCLQAGRIIRLGLTCSSKQAPQPYYPITLLFYRQIDNNLLSYSGKGGRGRRARTTARPGDPGQARGRENGMCSDEEPDAAGARPKRYVARPGPLRPGLDRVECADLPR